MFGSLARGGVFAVALLAGAASAHARGLVGTWRGVAEVEDGKTLEIPKGKRILWEFAKKGIFRTRVKLPKGKKPFLREGTWALRKGELTVEIRRRKKLYAVRHRGKRLELRELPDKKHMYVLVRQR